MEKNINDTRFDEDELLELSDNERGIFSLSGITGMLIATVLLLTILAVLVFNAVVVQQNEAQNFYKVNQSLDGLKANSVDNNKNYQLVGKPE